MFADLINILQMGAEKGFSAFPESDNLFKWIGTIQGPSGTVRYCKLPERSSQQKVYF